MPRKPPSPSAARAGLTVEQAEHLLKHALPPDARKAIWRRTFSADSCRELERLGVTTGQRERLERMLPAVAYYAAPGPRLADARAPLRKLAADAHKAAAALRVVLERRDDAAVVESRRRLLQAIEGRHPERCRLDPARVSTWEPYDHRKPEALRMLAALQDVEDAARHALAAMPKSQTRAAAHPYPVALIDAALVAAGGKVFPPSASPAAPFLGVAAACYAAAGAPTAEPLRPVRAFLSERNGSLKK